MQIFSSFIKVLDNLFPKKQEVKNVSFQDIVNELSQPPKLKNKSPEEINRTYLIQEALFQLEVDMLKMEPPNMFRGSQRWKDNEGNTYFDWVYCSVRPEVVYCNAHRS